MGINPQNFVKDHPIFKNKGLFYANFGLVLQEIFFMLQKSILCGMGLELALGRLGLIDLQNHKCRILYPIFANMTSIYAQF